ILNRLAAAAIDAAAARRLAAEIGRGNFDRGQALGLLGAMVEAMPRLNLGTMDGFFARMVQAFPFELGLGGEFELLDEGVARRERQRVLALIFNAGAAGSEARDDFIEAF